MVEIKRVGAIKHLWGESLRWDDRLRRLYFVDAAALKVHWLEDGALEPHTMSVPSLPTGLVLTESGRVLAVLEDGVYLADVDARRAARTGASSSPRGSTSESSPSVLSSEDVRPGGGQR